MVNKRVVYISNLESLKLCQGEGFFGLKKNNNITPQVRFFDMDSLSRAHCFDAFVLKTPMTIRGAKIKFDSS